LIFNYKEKIVFGEDALDARYLFDYFNKLKKLENHFDVRFVDISLDDANENYIDCIIAYLDKIVLDEEFNGMTFKNDNLEEFNFIINNGENERVLLISENEKSVVNLHGLDFTIGYLQKYVNDAYVDNLEDLKNDVTKEISIKSKSSIVYYQYTDNNTMITHQ
jgi:hypothetical protein